MNTTSLARPLNSSVQRRLSSRFFRPGKGAFLGFALVLAPAAWPVAAAPQVESKPSGEAAATVETAAPDADKVAEDMARMRADLLAKHQGADEARLMQLMGPPAEKGTRDAELTLVWRGPAGGGDPLPCRIAATLVEGGLANIELSGHPAWDRKTCRKFLRPLLQAMPWKSIEHPSGGTAGATPPKPAPPPQTSPPRGAESRAGRPAGHAVDAHL
jgi:hypothetical protein